MVDSEYRSETPNGGLSLALTAASKQSYHNLPIMSDQRIKFEIFQRKIKVSQNDVVLNREKKW